MTHYKTTLQLRPEDAAYIAGLVDGEGTITLSRRHANDRRQLLISIANTERPLLEFVLRASGVGKITRKRTSAAHHTASFCYAVSNRQALALLQQLGPYLRSYKQRRATLALKWYVRMTPRNGKYTPSIEHRRCRFERAFFAVKPNGRHKAR